MRQLMLFALLLSFTACQQQGDLPKLEAINSSPVVAVVNGISIHESDIDNEMANLPDPMIQYRNDPKARTHILRSLIRRIAISQKAKRLGLDMNPAIKQRMQAAQRQILIGAAKSWQLAQMVVIQTSEIEAYYNNHYDEFSVPEQAHARHILLGSEKEAWQVLKKLRRNRSLFEKLAASHSLDSNNKSRGGNLNWFPRGVMVKAFDDVAFSLKKNGLSTPVKTKFGWHIIELLGKRPAMQKPVEEVRDEIISTIEHQRLQQWYELVEKEMKISITKPEYQ
ncbi:hypothetical protein D8Y20_01900 [Mariprofundus sp. EBB-1]|uniref:peptidylprolyl isomerase n=1 Tax=Mariprofundus sp. EBB-1 TaxID=2650971 RepID=UPI000EF28391|nr:peptidylprolyl isomerase [Mariprofundus sp. EBB-1]RLL54972.1 hypothetical protein D8Y20_01900 [Mariprofundus sp. EBB-1]